MSPENPIGLEGIEFVEYATTNPKSIQKIFTDFGFKKLADHKNQKIELWRQGDINFLINTEPNTFAENFQKVHGSSICSMSFRVQNSKQAFDEAVKRGALPYKESLRTTSSYPAIYGIGDSLIYFVDKFGSKGNIYEDDYRFLSNERTHKGYNYTVIDHLTNNVPKGEMQKWCDFYEKIFGFKEKRFFDIKGKSTGLISKVMRSHDGRICIPINEPTDKKSQIQEYLNEYHGSGIQHLALLTTDIVSSVAQVNENGVEFLDVPPSYYEMIHDRVPNVTERTEALRDLSILVDGDTKGYLLQIFTKNLVGPIFFEVIQRKGHDGFGDGNFQALFDAIERDQMKRGVI